MGTYLETLEASMERTIPATRAKNNFGEVIREVYCSGVGVIVEKSGIPVVAIVPISDYESLLKNRKTGGKARGRTD